MSSLKLPDAMKAAGGAEALLSAVADVAERSFFSLIERCDETRFAELAASHEHWLTATVHFEEPEWAGEVVCNLPAPLAERMCDTFVGREPDNLAPEHEDVIDMVGEFANMICGAWLTRAANRQTFTLSQPAVVTHVGESIAAEARRGMLFSIDGLPWSVDVQFFAMPETVSKGA